MKRTLSCAAALAALAAASGAAAQPRTVVVSTHVAYGDLDLSTGEGASAMYRRIHAAAVRLCAQPASPVLPRTSSEVRRCASGALAGAVAELNAPLVTALAQAQGPVLASVK